MLAGQFHGGQGRSQVHGRKKKRNEEEDEEEEAEGHGG